MQMVSVLNIDIVRPPSRLAPHLSQVFCVKNVSILFFLSVIVKCRFSILKLKEHIDEVISFRAIASGDSLHQPFAASLLRREFFAPILLASIDNSNLHGFLSQCMGVGTSPTPFFCQSCKSFCSISQKISSPIRALSSSWRTRSSAQNLGFSDARVS